MNAQSDMGFTLQLIHLTLRWKCSQEDSILVESEKKSEASPNVLKSEFKSLKNTVKQRVLCFCRIDPESYLLRSGCPSELEYGGPQVPEETFRLSLQMFKTKSVEEVKVKSGFGFKSLTKSLRSRGEFVLWG